MTQRDKGIESAQQKWENILDRFKPMGKYLDYEVTAEAAELLPHYLMRTLSHAYIFMSRADPDYPEFIAYANIVLNIFGPNPDAVYWISVIDGNNSYRIYGNRGTVHEVNFLIGKDFMGMGPDYGDTFHGADLDDFQINGDGSFEILLSTEKPEGYTGNWMPLDTNANYIFVRNIGYAPGEQDPSMAIEKVGGPSPSKSKILDFDKIVDDMADYLQHSAELYLLLTESLARKGIVNNYETAPFADKGGSTSQVYHQGLIDIKADEALVIEVKIPESCTYWNIQVSDLFLQNPDYMRYQTYLNGHVDRSDSDGVTRFVLSQTDPGVANWIDLVDVEKGYMVIRYIDCAEEPKPTFTKMPFADVGNYLPADTAKVTPEQRRQDLRERFSHYQLRRYW